MAGDPASDVSGRREIQRVLHVARGMIGRHVERFEVVIVVLELRPLEDEEAHAAEDRFDALAQQRQGMTVAERRGPARQRDVHRVRRRARRLGRRDALVEARFDLLLQLVRQLAEERTRVGGRRPERLEQRGDEPALSREIPIAHGAERGRARGLREIALELRPEGLDVGWKDLTSRFTVQGHGSGCANPEPLNPDY